MATELEKVLNRLKVTVKARELVGTPARGFAPGIRCWRVSVDREVKGSDKTSKLPMVILSATEPTVEQVMTMLIRDVEAGEMTQWDFAQAYCNGVDDEQTERMHKTCKRIGPRVHRFFGDGWAKVVNHLPQAA
ncbi:MAG TPA: hypothetical protein VF077_09555 [Nitrospiraceae bacterium]